MKAEDYLAPGETRIVMCPPRFLDNKTPNNVFMDTSQPINRERAMTQYRRVRTAIESFGVEVLEIPEQRGAQDQTFAANIAISIDPYIVLANYKAPGRAIEVEPARRFFESLGYPPEECDAWYVWLGVGPVSLLLALMPYELPWIGWFRQGRGWDDCHWVPAGLLRRRL